MSERDDVEYYRERALRERELAESAPDATIARVHIELAQHYEKIVEATQVEATASAEGFDDR